MRAAFITGPTQLEVREVPIPEPAPGQVRIRVEHVGICGSDLGYFYHGRVGANLVREPLTPGHELSGRVDSDPSGTWAPGTPVTVHPARFGPPQEAYPHSPHLWPGGSYLGSAATMPHTQGALAEFLVVEASMIRPLPTSLPVRRAVLAEPLAVGLHALTMAGPVAGKHVLVAGAGPIGLLAMAAALHGGAASVAATDILPGPLSRAAELGVDETFDVTSEEVPSGFDVVLECTGVAASLTTAFSVVRPQGSVVLVGMMPAEPAPVVLAPIGTREVTVVGSFRFKDEIDGAIALLDANPEIEQVITHEINATDAGSLIGAMHAAQDSARSGKVIVNPWQV